MYNPLQPQGKGIIGGQGRRPKSRLYMGQIATRGFVPVTLTAPATATQMMSRSPHISRQAITQLKIIIPNFYVNPSAPFQELGTGATATVTASIEYPASTFTQVTFNGGATSYDIPDLSMVTSDFVTVAIPDNTVFYVRIYFVCAGGIVYNNVHPLSSFGAGVESGTSGVTDKTMSGTVTTANSHLDPCAIIGWTDKSSIIILGDSKTHGTGDSTADATRDFGEVARAVGGNYAYINLARGSDKASAFVDPTATVNRRALMAYGSHLICNYGYNDVSTDSGPTTFANLNLIWTYARSIGLKVFQTTIGPRTSSSDSWATLAGQTKTTPNTANTLALNFLIRRAVSNPPGVLAGVIEQSNVISSSPDSGLWPVDGTSNKYTADGLHESTAGYTLIRDSGCYDATLFTGGRLEK